MHRIYTLLFVAALAGPAANAGSVTYSFSGLANGVAPFTIAHTFANFLHNNDSYTFALSDIVSDPWAFPTTITVTGSFDYCCSGFGGGFVELNGVDFFNGSGDVFGSSEDYAVPPDMVGTFSVGTESVTISEASAPEPGVAGLFASGALALAWLKKKRRLGR